MPTLHGTAALLLGAGVFLAMMAGLFVPLEAFFPATPHRPAPRALATGAGLFVANTLLMQWLGVPVLRLVASSVSAVERPGVARLVAVFVLADLVGYGVHRAMHRVPVLWRFHAVHHAPRHVSWFDAWRQHPVDFVLHGVAVGLPGALLGASLSDVASVVLLRKAFTTFLHLNVRLGFGVLLASPDFHRVHHGHAREDFDTNFAGTFPVWDVLFGTHRRVSERTSPSPATT